MLKHQEVHLYDISREAPLLPYTKVSFKGPLTLSSKTSATFVVKENERGEMDTVIHTRYYRRYLCTLQLLHLSRLCSSSKNGREWLSCWRKTDADSDNDNTVCTDAKRRPNPLEPPDRTNPQQTVIFADFFSSFHILGAQWKLLRDTQQILIPPVLIHHVGTL